MKKQCLKLALVLFAVVGVVFPLQFQPSSPTPSKTYDSGNDGRYKLVVTTGSYDTQYVIDTQTGRVWHSVVDTDKKMILFVSYTYQNIDGEMSKIPNEAATSVVSRSQSAPVPSQSASTSQPGDDPALASLAEAKAQAVASLVKAGDMDGAKKIVDSIQDEALKSLVRAKVDKALKQ